MSAETIPERIDLEKLSSPIPGERPAGEYLRYEGTYDRIREARREDDSTLSRGIYKTELKRADWRAVANICAEALEARTKDLQIAAWLMEAWLRLRGFAGCRDGLVLLRELLEGFWEQAHPQLSEGDPEDRAHTFVWVNEKLSTQLKLVPLTSPQAGDLAPYSFADWESACRLEQLGERDPKELQAAEAQGRVTLARFQASAMLTATPFFMELADDLSGAAEACLALDELLDEKFGKQSPGLERFKETLGAVQHLVADVLHARPEEAYLAAREEASPPPAAEPEAGREMWSAAPIRSRAEAYWRLAEAAEYLLRTEPHSPTPYLVKRAVEWGSMSLQEVLQQIVRNDGEMQEIARLLRLAPDGRK